MHLLCINCFLQCEKIIFIKKSLYIYRKYDTSLTGCKMSEKKLSFAPEARMERLAILAALGYDVSEHARWYLEGLKFSLYEAGENVLESTETARRIREMYISLNIIQLNKVTKKLSEI